MKPVAANVKEHQATMQHRRKPLTHNLTPPTKLVGKCQLPSHRDAMRLLWKFSKFRDTIHDGLWSCTTSTPDQKKKKKALQMAAFTKLPFTGKKEKPTGLLLGIFQHIQLQHLTLDFSAIMCCTMYYFKGSNLIILRSINLQLPAPMTTHDKVCIQKGHRVHSTAVNAFF